MTLTHTARPTPKMFSPLLWSSLKMVLKPRRKDTGIGVLLEPLAQALLWLCGASAWTASSYSLTENLGLAQGQGRWLFTLGPCPFLSTDGTLSRIPLAWNSEGWVTFLDSLQVPTQLRMIIVPKEVFSFETAHRLLLTFWEAEVSLAAPPGHGKSRAWSGICGTFPAPLNQQLNKKGAHGILWNKGHHSVVPAGHTSSAQKPAT